MKNKISFRFVFIEVGDFIITWIQKIASFGLAFIFGLMIYAKTKSLFFGLYILAGFIFIFLYIGLVRRFHREWLEHHILDKQLEERLRKITAFLPDSEDWE